MHPEECHEQHEKHFHEQEDDAPSYLSAEELAEAHDEEGQPCLEVALLENAAYACKASADTPKEFAESSRYLFAAACQLFGQISKEQPEIFKFSQTFHMYTIPFDALFGLHFTMREFRAA